MRSSKLLKELHQQACLALEYSYSPYSKHKVGAAVLMSDGKLYSGTNIENASYGGTVCAERVSIWKAISQGSAKKITHLVVVTNNSKKNEAWPPCGFCRQVIAEFADASTKISIGNKEKITKTFSFKQLLPKAFMPSHLLKK